MKKSMILLLCLIGFLLLTTIGCAQQTQSDTPKVDISSVVKEAFITDKGYTGELTKYMTEDVFAKTNIYKIYPVNDLIFKKPVQVDFSIREVSQKRANDKLTVNMVYSVEIKDANNQLVGGSKEIPISFTVQTSANGWRIVAKEEKA